MGRGWIIAVIIFPREMIQYLKICVRRERRCSSAGMRPARQRVAPAGSNRSGGGGNEAAGVFDGEGHTGDLASRQALTHSERRAGLETDNAGADPFAITGKAAIVGDQSRVKPVERQTPRSRRGNDEGMPAQESNATREAPTVEAAAGTGPDAWEPSTGSP